MIDDLQLDMLVDGELSEEERREVLLRLDSEPDGWRRCALAFLEAQSWREAMRSVSDESAAAAPGSRKRWSSWARLRTVLAVAASFLLALGLGLAFDELAGRGAPNSAPIRSADHLAKAPPREAEGVEAPAVPLPEPVSELQVPYQLQVPYDYVSLPVQDPVSGETEAVPMPVVPREYLGEGWPYRLPSVLPDRVVQTLRQHGHDVVQQRHLVPFQAADGSRVVFPVDEVQIVPVANRGYQ